MESDLDLQMAIASCYSDHAAERWKGRLEESNTDWGELAAHAADLGLASLLYETIRRTDLDSVPHQTLAALRRHYYDTAGQNLLILRELVAIQRTLDEVGIDAVVLKGAALVLYVYEKLAYRPMVDIDLLIRFEDLTSAKNQLAHSGYIPSKPAPFEDDSGLFWNEILLSHQLESRPAVELHWRLLDNPYYATRLHTEDLIRRSHQLNLAEISPKVLSLEDQIIHLSCHNLYHHLGSFRRSQVDVAFLISRFGEEISWDDVVELAERSDTRGALRSMLIELSDNWYVAVPDPVLKLVQGWQPSRRERLYVRSQENEYARATRTLSALPGGGYKLRYLKGQLFPSREYLEWRYELEADATLAKGYLRRWLSGLRGLGRAVLRKS